MKIRLIQPSQLDERGKPARLQKLFMPFLTMPTLAGLTPAGVDVAITEDYVEDIDYEEEVDLVGLTAQTCQAPRAYQIADEFRKRGTKTIMGGIHASMCPEEALRHVDSVVVGEAEDLWAGILADAKANELREMYVAADRPDLGAPVIPRFDLLDYSNYVVPPFARTPLLPIQTTRGCPHNCDFCSVARYMGNTIRKKNVAHVIREIEAAKPSRVFFTDDNIIGDPKYARDLFTALKPLRLRWACQMSTRIASHPDLIELAAEAGCHETFIGIESLNDQALRSMHKGFNKSAEFGRMFEQLKNVGILAQASFVFGFDDDTAEDLRRVVERVMTWDVNYLYIFILTPFPGTGTHQKITEQGRILSADWSQYDAMHSVMKFKNMTAESLFECLWDAYGKFYATRSIWKRVWRFRKQYIRFFPRDMAIEEVFFQSHMGRAIAGGSHPFTLGLKATPS
jgi:radical SAM superfamily enzyme YgiQ (UPF0313 family)